MFKYNASLQAFCIHNNVYLISSVRQATIFKFRFPFQGTVDLISKAVKPKWLKGSVELYLRVQCWHFHCYNTRGNCNERYLQLYSLKLKLKIECGFCRVIHFWVCVDLTPKAKAICDDNFASVGERNMPFIRTRVGIKALKRNCCQGELC